MIAGVQIEFFLFALMLIGVAVFRRRTFEIAIVGVVVITGFRWLATPFNPVQHLYGEWQLLLNLFGLLMGFALLARHFEESHLPAVLPRWLPSGWMGGFTLLVFIFVLSSFLDNIAAALIGGTIARVVFRRRVHIGYLAAIVAASNAGGAGSVVGDTTTTMMWIGGVSPADVLHAYVGAGVAIVMCGLVATYQQQRLRPITHTKKSSRIDGGRLLIVVGILVSAFLANLLFDFPAIGVWLAILVGAIFRTTHWPELRQSLKGSVFLVALVWCASLMPVNSLPDGSVLSVFVMGFLSAVSGSITLTKLALDQGGYDWGYVAYAAGYGGSMIWFGSSAGVALINLFPKGRSVGLWMKNGWHVTVSYIVGFTVMLALLGWHPQEKEMPKSVDLSVGK
jgi:Na+/H+ antiporter NhaD/arsenite permease-like protein